MPLPTCTFIPSLGMFRVEKRVGKTLTSGGYGVSLKSRSRSCDERDEGAAVEQRQQQEHDDHDNNNEQDKPQEDSLLFSSMDHLYIEEALFLQQQGLLQVMMNDKPYSSTAQLYPIMLDSLQDVSLPTYLSYAHLRSQDYRVLRHDPGRLTDDGNDKRRSRTAPPQPAQSLLVLPSWDVYYPNTHFRKTDPGVPDLCVVVTTYTSTSSSSMTFDQLQKLLDYVGSNNNNNATTSLQVAAVADSGTVVMFGVTSHGVQDISRVE